VTLAQKRAIEAYRFRDLAGLGDERPVTSAIGSGLLASAGILSVIPGGQLPAAIIAAVGALTGLIGGFFKPDLTKEEASSIVDKIEAQTMKPLRASWQSLPAAQKTQSMQAQYLAVFDGAWNQVVQGCANPALGSAGQACTGDRAQGACHYTLDGHTPGQPPSNCGNWFTWYRDVIANDPNVIPDPLSGSSNSSVAESISTSLSTLFSGNSVASPMVPLLIGGALLLFALSMD
jgi:hypothetical protein